MMRSIPWAMTWEMLHRGRWTLLAAFLTANALPIALFTALRQDGAFDPHDQSVVIMHMVLMQIGAFIVGAAVLAAQGDAARLYVFPLPTSTLVAWRLLPAMGFMFLQSVASTVMLNALFPLDWPLWGPAMFLAVALAAIYAAIWLAEKSGWVVCSLTVVSALLGLWNKSRYGEIFSQPKHMWREVTAGEVAAMLAVALCAYGLAVFAVARNRRGDSLPELGIVAWLRQAFDTAADVGRPFRTPADAQFWHEWRRKGWAMPAAMMFCVCGGVGCWMLFSRDPRALAEGFFAGGLLLSLLALICGVVLGNTGPQDSNFEIGSFLATRPLTSAAMARTILKMAALSVLAAWAVWAVAFLAIYLLMLTTASVPAVALPKPLGWWYFPATLLGPWIATTMGIAVGLTGRMQLFVKAACGALAVAVAASIISQYAFSPPLRLQVWHFLVATAGVTLVLVAAWTAVMARRRKLIEAVAVYFMVAAWAILSGLAVLDFALAPRAPVQVYIFVAGLAALVLAPLGIAPLALAWNRVR